LDNQVPGGPLVGLYRHVTAGGFPEEYQEKENKTLRARTISGTSRIHPENQNTTRINSGCPAFFLINLHLSGT